MTSIKKNMEKINKHLILSLILLLPASIYLENSDGLDKIDDIYGAASEWITAFIISLVIALSYWGIFFKIKTKSSFVKALYKSCYLVSFLCFGGFWIGIIVSGLGIWGILIFFLIIFLLFSKRGKKYISKLNLFSKENNTNNNKSKSVEYVDSVKEVDSPNNVVKNNNLNSNKKNKSKSLVDKLFYYDKKIASYLFDGIKSIFKNSKQIDDLKKKSSKKTKDQAIEELKKLKELLDLELIKQEEFDIKSKELKKIILGN